MGESYRAAGVDIAAGEAAVERIAPLVRSTFRPEVLGDLGGFGGLFALAADRYREPVLVAGTDTVGTKALVASLTGRYDTIGIDLVAMCVDDIVCHGAEPLFLLDCLSVGRLVPDQVEQLVSGVAEGCRRAGCALIGGEMAENPGLFPEGEFDLAGFAVGVVERDRLVTGERVEAGDRLVGLPSPGLRCNGYSLARKVLLETAGRSLDDRAFAGAPRSLADELLEPSVIYAPAVLELTRSVDVRAVAHVTGGGIPGNLARVMHASVDAIVDRGRWEAPRVFGEIRQLGDVDEEEMARVFNLGIGMIVVVPPDDVHRAIDMLRLAGHLAVDIGEVVDGAGRVVLEG